MIEEETKEFIIHPTTPIGWGKFKGQPHSDLLLKENKTYSTWIINQGDEFRYKDTRIWVMKHMQEDNTKNRYFTITIDTTEIDKDPNSMFNITESNVVSFTNELLMLTRKYKDFVKLSM